MSSANERVDKLSAKQKELYAMLLRRKRQAERTPRGVPRPRPPELPLSFSQQRLWFINELQPLSPVYNIPCPVRLRGPLDIPALEKSLNAVIARHEAMRTTFELRGGQVVQVVHPPQPFQLEVLELSQADPAAREEAARRLIEQDYQCPFDLASGPLFRAFVVRLGKDDHIFAFTMHHIVGDDWSIGVLIREVAMLYESFAQGREANLPELPIQYPDYALWQRDFLQGETLDRQLAYWTERLAGLEPLELPTDFPRPAVQTHRGDSVPVVVPQAVAEPLRRLAQREGVTTYMVLLAAFQTLLYRYTGRHDIAVGSPIANRNRTETEGLIGCFVNTLVLRADLSGNPSFRALLAQVRETTLGAYAHQELPFESIVEHLHPERRLSHTPLFQVAFVLQNTVSQLAGDFATASAGGLQFTPYGVRRGTAKFDLTLNLSETPQEMIGVIEYNADLFAEPTARRMAAHLVNLLAAAVEDPERRIGALGMLGEEEIARETREPRMSGETIEPPAIHQWFERQAAARPQAVALTCEQAAMTYAELNRRANQMAHHLRELGVGPESRVAICLEPSAEMLAAILGILKAGGAYVPLSPAQPRDRIAYVLDDAGIAVAVAGQASLGLLERPGLRVVCVERDAEEIEGRPAHDPAGGVTAENLAYIIYTSGSTGRPKGVGVTHGNVLRLLSATDEWFDFTGDDVWTLFHSYAFDFSVWEMYGALLRGGRLVVVPYWMARNPEAFYELLCREGVTVLNQTPSAFRQLARVDELAAEEQRRRLRLRAVIFGGEALELQGLRGWFERHGDERPAMINMYGITETTVHVTYRQVRRADLERQPGSPIGVPIPDLSLHLLDEHLNPVPAGVVGEIYVGGAGLARGYVNRPELTAERFLPGPFGGRPGERLYKSGDLARRLPDGELEYVGRGDQQVKIRGYRIELGEIEAALSAHPGVREAVVLARPDGGGDRRLVAYIVSEGEAGVPVEELRAGLLERLPEYMVPAAFVALESLPLTANGKLDRRALPAPDSSRPDFQTAYVAPRDAAEAALAEIWAASLGLRRAGIDDNYFALGGDSIRSIQVRAQARERGLDFELQDLFRHQTIRELAANLRRVGAPADAAGVAPFALLSEEDRARLPEGVEDAYPLAQLQAGMLFHSEYSREEAVYHNVSSFHLRAPFDEGALGEAVRALVARHEILRTSFDLTGFSEPLQLVHGEAAAPLTVKDLRDIPADRQVEMLEEFMAAERGRRFDWGRPPLLRFAAHRRSDDSFEFTLTEHHAILDGWSVASMLTELFRTYLAILAGHGPQPGAPPARYAEYVALERAALASPESADYWEAKLAGSAPTLLPRIHRPAGGEGVDVQVIGVPVSEATSQGLKRLAAELGVPVKSVLLAAHLRVLGAVTGKADVVSGLVTNGRPEVTGGDRTLGLFLNTVPFRARLGGGSWAELVEQVFAQEAEMAAHRRYPLGEMQKRHSGQPLFEASFNFTHFHVYDSLQSFDGIQLLGASGSAATNFTLGVNFTLDLATHAVMLSLHCNVAAVGEPLAEQLAGAYERALAEMAARPRADHRRFSALSPRARRHLLYERNDTRRDYQAPPAVHQLFEAQAARRPGAIAIIAGERQVTYGELNRQADAVARRVRDRIGMGEGRVALFAERTPALAAGVFGVLKSGNAFVPLDPDLPEERQRYIIEDAGVSLVVAARERQAAAAEFGVPVLCLQDCLEEDDGRELAPAPVTAQSLAYIIYTSGSTGLPKGVMVEHGALVNHNLAVIEAYGLHAGHRVFHFLPFVYDASLEEFFPLLAAGGSVVMHAEAARLGAAGMLAECARRGVNYIHLPAVYWEQVQEALGAAGEKVPRQIELFVVGGESPSNARVAAWAGMQDEPSRFINAYGPTEATITCLRHVALPGMRLAPNTIKLPIGEPIGNLRAYVLDERLEPLPPGVTGRLFVAGAGLARGYANQPDLTAERYLPNPHATGPGERLYDTGDLARVLPQHGIEFLGRADGQVKIRGHRVEIGEIEAQLRRHAGVEDVYVTTHGEAGDMRLVAYVAGGAALNAAVLRGFLRKRLPEYMIPSAFVRMARLPYNANGKLMREELPAPVGGEAGPATEFVAPRTEAEAALAEIWARLLGLERVGVTADFFELGGHSITATRLVTQVRKTFEVEMSVRTVFERPTIAEQAEAIESLIIEQIEALDAEPADDPVSQ